MWTDALHMWASFAYISGDSVPFPPTHDAIDAPALCGKIDRQMVFFHVKN